MKPIQVWPNWILQGLEMPNAVWDPCRGLSTLPRAGVYALKELEK